MTWVYLSPHFDDIALSCGGLAWEQSQAGEPVQVWTICAGEVPAGPLSPFAAGLHTRWEAGQNAPSERSAEDLAACRLMGAIPYHFDLPDCIYRRGLDQVTHLYASEEGIFGPVHADEEGLVARLAADLQSRMPAEAVVVCPLALGGHVDHRLTRAAVEQIDCTVWYYADYPYVLRSKSDLAAMCQSGWRPTNFLVSEAGLEAWFASVAAYASQLSTFWPDSAAMQAALRDYWQSSGCGVQLWRKTHANP
jgi:LmbE family N-acetylglucosaminyl deacetylase